MKGTAARLKRLEGRAGMGARCAHCRLYLRATWIGVESDGRTAANSKDERLVIDCRFCGNQYGVVILAEWPEWKRDIKRLSNTYKEDEFYTNKKACAVRFFEYFTQDRAKALRESRKELEEALVRCSPDWKPVASSGHGRRANPIQKKSLTKKEKVRQGLIDEYLRDLTREQRAMIKKYGHRFPELEELARDMQHIFFHYSFHQKPDVEGDDLIKMLRAWAALETVIWGAPLPHTLEEIAEQERGLAQLAAAIDEKARKEEEARAERDRKYQEDRDRSAREKLTLAEARTAFAHSSEPLVIRPDASPTARDTDPPRVPTYSEWLAGARIATGVIESHGAPNECIGREPARMQGFPDDLT
ncbi:MAG: hypothetical protein QOG71_2233 [Pyrinomonadaceae bacterium]|nr:hypothetical protein [Pyrinomonadaceae bacterium]